MITRRNSPLSAAASGHVEGNEWGRKQRNYFGRSTAHLLGTRAVALDNCTLYFGSAPMRVRRLQLFARVTASEPLQLRVGTDHRIAEAGQALLEVRHERTDRQDDAIDAAPPALLDGGPRLDRSSWAAGRDSRQSSRWLQDRDRHLPRRGAPRRTAEMYQPGSRWTEKAVAQAAGAARGRFGMAADDDGHAADRLGIAASLP